MRTEETALEGGQKGVRTPRASVKVRRGLGSRPGRRSPAPPPPAPPAAARIPGRPGSAHTALSDSLAPLRIRKMIGSARVASFPGLSRHKRLKPRKPRQRNRDAPTAAKQTHPSGPSLRVYNQKRLRLRGCPAGWQGRGLV